MTSRTTGATSARSRTAALVAALGLALLGAACSSPSTAPAPQAAEQNQPRRGGRLTLDVSFDINNLDISTSTRRESFYTQQSFNQLTRFKSGPDVGYTDLILQPQLAEKWEVSPDAKSYTFHLRKDVKFANLAPVNGRQFTSSDVKFTYEYVARAGEFADKKLPASLNNWVLEGLDRVETPDPSTVVVRFKEPFIPFVSYSSTGFLSILPREIYDQEGSFKDRRIGTGPYQLDAESSQRGSRLVWKRNADYWESGKPYLDEIYQLVLPDDSLARAALVTKQLDMMTDRVSPTTVDEVKRSNPGIVVYEFVPPGPLYMSTNTRNGLMSDERLRKAFDLALDRDEMIRTFTGGKGKPAVAGAFQDTFTPEEVKQLTRYDLEEAKRLVAQAGYPNGVEVEYIYPGKSLGERYFANMQLVQAQVKKAGINLAFKAVDDQDATLRRRRGEFVMSAGSTIGLFADIDSYLTSLFHPNSTNNQGLVNDPTLTAMIEAQRREPDAAKRKDIVRQASRYIVEHALGLTVLYYDPSFHLWQPYVKNVYPHWANPGTTYTPDLTSLWLEK